MYIEKRDRQAKFLEELTQNTHDIHLSQFIQHLYSGVSHEDLTATNSNWLLYTAQSTYNLLQNRKPGEFKVHIYRNEEWNEKAVLEVISEDMPFLVDSIGNELKKQDLNIHLIAHPTICVTRNNQGKFQGFTDGTKEAILQFHFSKFVSDSALEALQNNVIEILECVNLSVKDWQTMRKLMVTVTEELAAKPFCETAINKEACNFLQWLKNDNFVFLGACEYRLTDEKLVPLIESSLGIAKHETYKGIIQNLDEQFTNNTTPLVIRKFSEKSLVHRNAHMDSIFIKRFENGKCIATTNFLGFFTSSVYFQSVKTIPLIRQKVQMVLDDYGYPLNSHNSKELLTALESFPRSELLQMEIDELYNTATGIVSLGLRPRVKLFIRQYRSEKFLSCLVFIPKNRFSTNVKNIISDIICTKFSGTISKQYVQINESQLARLQLIIQTKEFIEDFDIESLEKKIIKSISQWSDNLNEELRNEYPVRKANQLANKYGNGFDIKYTSTFDATDAVKDIKRIEEILVTNQLKFAIDTKDEDSTYIKLAIYHLDDELSLSSILPSIEHLGCFCHDVRTFKVTFQELGKKQNAFIQHFRLLPNNNVTINSVKTFSNIENALEKIWDKSIDDDNFNSLIITANLEWQQVIIMRIYAKYLKQIKFSHDNEYIVEALSNNPPITNNLVRLFEEKFNPKIKKNNEVLSDIKKEIISSLEDVESITEDNVIRAYLNLIKATNRTNYFQNNPDGTHKDYVSIKISPRDVKNIPNPKPFAEIVVYSPRVEAYHLRGGKFARGGLRWSSRYEDVRTEVLGLVKAQMPKNTIIVPVGSKGAFIVKNNCENDPKLLQQEAVNCYKIFLKGMLDITDNIVDGKVVHPINTKTYDGEDPYLVVAADKGTATFSDYANEVSKSYNFWLGDAFASGGSVGYDHKKMGITAKGAWISVERHFAEMGKDITKEPFTVVGIGDMSGDVFGNGMLLSRNIKLVAAFNHMHIFIDPNPATDVSFKERERLFKKPRSSWMDYNKELISKGGGIYPRNLKQIKLSKEACKVLGLETDTFAPDDLIHNILKAPVDLLWNGGIGTYVKSSKESHASTGDKANNSLRVDGCDLRCRIVGEGGNLGLTQMGRIEYGLKGGRINTDFIDNSAGVDCSDHEVNIKITLESLLHKKKITQASRVKIMQEMTKDVEKLVLRNNYLQNQIISIERDWSDCRVEDHTWLIKNLENSGELDRVVEKIPNNDDLAIIKSDFGALSRPTIAILIAYAKNSIFHKLADIDFSKDKFFEQYLINYFPKQLQKNAKKAILEHQLKNQIVATVLTNDFVNTMGCCLLHQILDRTNHSTLNVIKAFIIAYEVMEISKIWSEVESLLNKVDVKIQVRLFREIQQVIESNMLWILQNQKNIGDLQEVIDLYSNGTKQFAKYLDSKKCISNDLKNVYPNVPEKLLLNITTLKALTPTFDICFISQKSGSSISKVANIYLTIAELLQFNWMTAVAKNINTTSYIDKLAVDSLADEISQVHTQLTIKDINHRKNNSEGFFNCPTNASKMEEYDNFFADLKAETNSSMFLILTIALKKSKEFL